MIYHARAAVLFNSATFSPIPSQSLKTDAGKVASAVSIVIPVVKKLSCSSSSTILSPQKSTASIGVLGDIDEEDGAFTPLPTSSSSSSSQRTPEPPSIASAVASKPTSSSTTASASRVLFPPKPKEIGIIGTPAPYHYPQFFEKNLRKDDGEPNCKIKKLYGKEKNTIVDTPDFRGDITQVRKQGLRPDENGEIVVKRRRIGEATERHYKLHAEPNPETGINRMIPVSGTNMNPLKGEQIKELVEQFKEKRKIYKATSFRTYLPSNKSTSSNSSK